MPKVVTKKKCCKDKPRCKKCPVVLKRLSDAGYAERVNDDRRVYRVSGDVPKSAVKAARAR